MTSLQPSATTSTPSAAPHVIGDYLVSDVAEAQRRLSTLLGREEPVSVDVLRAAVEDPLYAMHLMASRSSPELLAVLLQRPPRREQDPLKQALPEAPADPSKAALLSRFARSMFEWTKTGYELATPEQHEARLAGCRACPNLRAPTGSLFQRIAASAGLDGHSCSLCGCAVAAKSRMARETCPGADPDRPGFNRWGQELAKR
jgi:hypothetical protein